MTASNEPRPSPFSPISPGYLAKRWPDYLPPRPSDRDLVSAALVRRASQWKRWPFAGPHERPWLAAHDPDLLAYLDDIAARSGWVELRQAKEGLGRVRAVRAFDPRERNMFADSLATVAQALPRFRALGALLADDDGDGLGLAPAPAVTKEGSATGGDEGSGSGGKRPRPTPTASEEEDTAPVIVLEGEDAEALAYEMSIRPRM